jgi:CRISPR/Cas system CSM-associated protein Csm3 (group 7 of RAMP superfamily)
MAEQRGRFRGNPPAEKPYAFVPIPPGEARQERPTGHHRYVGDLKTGTLEGTIVAHSPVHVASGQIELTGGQPPLVKAHFRRNGRLTIPGSSLKGAIRSIVEAISSPPSCLRVTRARFNEQPANVRACADKERLCVACRLFGAQGYLGQVCFHDAVLTEGTPAIVTIPSLFAPRTRERLYVADGKVVGRKFYRHGALARGNVPLEVCPPGAHFRLRADFENLSDAQLGLLLVALGHGMPRFHPKLGGAKPACCGSVEIRITDVQVVAARTAALDYDAMPQQVDIASLTSTTRLVNRDALQRLAQILTYPGEGQCPTESY